VSSLDEANEPLPGELLPHRRLAVLPQGTTTDTSLGEQWRRSGMTDLLTNSAYARQLLAAEHINNASGADPASHYHCRRRVIRNLPDQARAIAQRM